MSKLVSVLISVYNAEKYIEEAILSVVNQTYKNIEILVINDGSTDKTQEKLKKLAELDSRIKLFYQENLGICISNNKLIESSNGYYISIMDADDIMHKEKIEKQVDYMLKNQHVDVLGTDYIKIDKDGKIKKRVKVKKIKPYPINIALSVWYSYPVHHPTIMFKRELLSKFKKLYRPVPTFKNAPVKISKGQMADTYLFFRLILNGAVFDNINIPLFFYRVNVNTSLSSNDKEQTKLYVFRFLTKLLSRFLTGKSNTIYLDLFTSTISYKILIKKDMLNITSYIKEINNFYKAFNLKFNNLILTAKIKLCWYLLKQVLKYTIRLVKR